MSQEMTRFSHLGPGFVGIGSFGAPIPTKRRDRSLVGGSSMSWSRVNAARGHKVPGNPTRCYRTREPLRVVGEVVGWEGYPPGVLQAMLDCLAELKPQAVEAIND